jgi:hypothetical protein
LQLTHKIGLPGDEFHVCVDLESRANRRAVSLERKREKEKIKKYTGRRGGKPNP